MHAPWPSAAPQARRATHQPSRQSWPASAFRGPDVADRRPAQRPSWRIARIRPVRSVGNCAGEGSVPSFRSCPIRLVTVCGEVVPAVARRPSTPRHRRSATRSSDASTSSSSGAVWPADRHARHRLPGPPGCPYRGSATTWSSPDRPVPARPPGPGSTASCSRR